MTGQGVFIHITTTIMAIHIITGVEDTMIIEGHRLGMTTDHISIMTINVEIEGISHHNEIIEVQNETEALEACSSVDKL